MEKNMYALIYCFEGTDINNPFGQAIAVSTDIEKLRAEMAKSIANDSNVAEGDDGEPDEWNDAGNYEVESQGVDYALLRHRCINHLYASYKINIVDVL